MQHIQEVFNRIQGTKRERKQIQDMYKDALSSSQEYREVVEKIRGYQLRKKQIEEETKAEMGSEYEKFLGLKKDMEIDKELLTDIAINTLMKGETVQVKDHEDTPYEPVFSVKFKKSNVVNQKQG